MCIFMIMNIIKQTKDIYMNVYMNIYMGIGYRIYGYRIYDIGYMNIGYRIYDIRYRIGIFYVGCVKKDIYHFPIYK